MTSITQNINFGLEPKIIPANMIIQASPEITRVIESSPEKYSFLVKFSWHNENDFLLDTIDAEAKGWKLLRNLDGDWLLKAPNETDLNFYPLECNLEEELKDITFSDPLVKLEALGRIPPREIWEQIDPDFVEDFLEMQEFLLSGPHPLSKWELYSGTQILKDVDLFKDKGKIPIARNRSSDDFLVLGDDSLYVIDPYDTEFGYYGHENTFGTINYFLKEDNLQISWDIRDIISSIQKDSRYQQCIAWGEERKGHKEGTIAAHIEELEKNLEIANQFIENPADQQILKLLIHTHDTFKLEATPNVPITDPKSHASLAREYLEKRLGETYLSNMLQYHDELYAIWRKSEQKGNIDENRLIKLTEAIKDWDVFMAFTIIDNVTESKVLTPTQWAIDIMKKRVEFKIDQQKLFDAIVNNLGKK
jgi:hypothetical protein